MTGFRSLIVPFLMLLPLDALGQSYGKGGVNVNDNSFMPAVTSVCRLWVRTRHLEVVKTLANKGYKPNSFIHIFNRPVIKYSLLQASD